MHLLTVGDFTDGTELLEKDKGEMFIFKHGYRYKNNMRPTFRKVSRSPFLASILSLSMFPKGMSGKIFFGPFTPKTQSGDKEALAVVFRH